MEAKFFVGQAGVFQVQFYLVMSWLDSNVFFKVTHYNLHLFDSGFLKIFQTLFQLIELEEPDNYEHPTDQ